MSTSVTFQTMQAYDTKRFFVRCPVCNARMLVEPVRNNRGNYPKLPLRCHRCKIGGIIVEFILPDDD